GGVELQYINSSDDVLHFTIYMLVGAGGIGLPNIEPDEAEAVFVAEPMGSLVLTLSQAVRLEMGAGYRWVSDTNSQYYDNAGMSAFAATACQKSSTSSLSNVPILAEVKSAWKTR
ncbi:MAG: hypothetical protein JJ992_27325, partial [Planctomycetes bacterium]|nr:hypothetical protein [Planctomycetota bacterium]